MAARFIATCLIGLGLLSGCGRRASQEETDPAASAVVEDDAARNGVAAPPLYNAQGQVLPSEDRIAGLVLPRGLTEVRKTERKRVFRSEVPIRKLLEYFGPKLFTGTVERVGPGAVYRKATVQGVLRSSIKLDVAVLEIGEGLTRVSVKEIPPPPRSAPSLDETRTEARKQVETLY